MLKQLPSLVAKYEDLLEYLARCPSDIAKIKELSSLEPLALKAKELIKVDQDISASKLLLSDLELGELAKEELKSLDEQKEILEEEIKDLLTPKDPNDSKNIYLEIRAGSGGDEAGIFVNDLFKLYLRYAELNKWKVEIISSSENSVGGYKEIIALIKGQGVYARLKYEGGTHRVQRVPETESQGRIHTSAATVAIMPEVEDYEVSINPNDIKIDVFRSGGHGGQSVNTTDSAVRITHIPTGIVVSMQDEKSQHKNKDKALKILKARIYEQKMKEQIDENSSARKHQVGTGDRSERIRTYNFPQNRLTDHRTSVTLYNLDEIMIGGMLDPIINSLLMQANS